VTFELASHSLSYEQIDIVFHRVVQNCKISIIKTGGRFIVVLLQIHLVI